MQLSDLKPAKQFANQFGVKSIIYGPPGSGKTPVVNTAPRPLLLACEPGLLSMRNSTVPTWFAPDVPKLDEFWKWFFGSQETKNFDTIAVDSISQMADVYLQDALKTNKHGLKAYGEMASETMDKLRQLYYTKGKHTYLICKEGNVDGYKRPFMPGQQLNVDLPHLFDQILYLNIHNIPGAGAHKAFRCTPDISIMSRDRTGMLNEYEPPDFGAIVKKVMS
jgi:hypothetical protein